MLVLWSRKDTYRFINCMGIQAVYSMLDWLVKHQEAGTN